MSKKNSPFEDLLKNFKPTVSSPNGTSLTESKIEKLAAQAALLKSLTPYMNSAQEAEFKKRIFEQMMGDGTGILKEEKEPEGRSLEEFLETLK